MMLFTNSEYMTEDVVPTIKEKMLLWATKKMNSMADTMVRVRTRCIKWAPIKDQDIRAGFLSKVITSNGQKIE